MSTFRVRRSPQAREASTQSATASTVGRRGCWVVLTPPGYPAGLRVGGFLLPLLIEVAELLELGEALLGRPALEEGLPGGAVADQLGDGRHVVAGPADPLLAEALDHLQGPVEVPVELPDDLAELGEGPAEDVRPARLDDGRLDGEKPLVVVFYVRRRRLLIRRNSISAAVLSQGLPLARLPPATEPGAAPGSLWKRLSQVLPLARFSAL